MKYLSIILLTSLFSLINSCDNNVEFINVNQEYVTITGGSFYMGDEKGEDKEKPLHSVTLNDFKIGKYEVTNAQYCEFLNEKGNREGVGGTWMFLEYSKIELKGARFISMLGYENHPVVVISWEGAAAFAEWSGARLPTEAEWEYVSRGGSLTNEYTYSGSNQIDEIAWYERNSGSKTHHVGTKKSNELGVHDMSGNVWEWCNDWYDEAYYQTSPQQNPQGADTGSARVLRGGSWRFDDDYCRSSKRYNIAPAARNTGIGFRLAQSLE